MATIASEKDLVTKESCDANVKIMLEKIDKFNEKLNEFELNITNRLSSMPKQLADEFDKRYANKKTETTVDKIIWLIVSSTIITVVGLATSVVVLIKFLI